MMLAPLMVALVLGQTTSSDPYVRSRVTQGDKSAQCLYWTASSITWQQSSVGDSQIAGDGEFTAVRRSFQSWQNLFAQYGNLSLVEGPVVDDRTVGYDQNGSNRNLLLFRMRRCTDVAQSTDACWTAKTCANTYDCWEHGDATIGITLTTYDERSGIIYDSDIELNAASFTFTASDTNVSTDVQNTVTHEAGHFIGLDHTNASGSVMYPKAPPGETSKRTIDAGSADFVRTVYPKGQASQSCLHPTTDAELGKKGAGCATGGAEAFVPALAAWALLAVRRRRGGARG